MRLKRRAYKLVRRDDATAHEGPLMTPTLNCSYKEPTLGWP